MRDRDVIHCPHCVDGKVSVPGFKNGEPVVTKKKCTHCKGEGLLTLVVDAKAFSKKKPNIILPP